MVKDFWAILLDKISHYMNKHEEVIQTQNEREKKKKQNRLDFVLSLERQNKQN